MYALFIISYAVRIFIFLSIINVSGAYARKKNLTVADKPEASNVSEERFVDASRSYVGTTEVYKPDVGPAVSLSHSGGVAIARKKRCLLSLAAATGIAAMSDYFDCEESSRKKKKKKKRKKHGRLWTVPSGSAAWNKKERRLWGGKWKPSKQTGVWKTPQKTKWVGGVQWAPGKGQVVWNAQQKPPWGSGILSKPSHGHVVWNAQQKPQWGSGILSKPSHGHVVWNAQHKPIWGGGILSPPSHGQVVWNAQQKPKWESGILSKPSRGRGVLHPQKKPWLTNGIQFVPSEPEKAKPPPWTITTTPAPKKTTAKKRPVITTTTPKKTTTTKRVVITTTTPKKTTTTKKVVRTTPTPKKTTTTKKVVRTTPTPKKTTTTKKVVRTTPKPKKTTTTKKVVRTTPKPKKTTTTKKVVRTTPKPKKTTTTKKVVRTTPKPKKTATKKRPKKPTKVTKPTTPAPKPTKPGASASIPVRQKVHGIKVKPASQTPKELGTIVVDGFPKYDIIHAIIVTTVTPKYRVNGLLVLEFVHPKTGVLIHIPAIGGDEFINPQTGHRYLIYIDGKGQTFFIPKPSQPLMYVMDITAMIEKYMALARKKKWGQIVIKGIPKYDISKAIFVTKRQKKFDSDGNLILHFVHPITGQKIQVPAEGGDQYVLPTTSSSYVIFVDVQHRTLLIFKGTDRSVSSTTTVTNVNINTQVVPIYVGQQKIPQKGKWGSVVRQGLPKYDISRAVFVEKAETVITFDGFLIMQFVHPITKQTIRIPLEGADEYKMPTSQKVYIIFVDTQHRTLLISRGIGQTAFPNQFFKEGKRPTKYIINMNNNGKLMHAKYGRMAKEKHWGSTAKGGIPKYDVSRGIFVERVDRVIDEDAFLVIQFVHPITKQTIRVPSEGADEYVLPATDKVYIIFVDAQARTLLIFKGKHRSAGTHPEHFVSINNININTHDGRTDANNGKMPQLTKWGSVVKGGVPKYSIPRAIFVEKVDRMIDAQGLLTIQFTHPITGQVIRTPTAGADEYVIPANSKVYVIIVDTQGRTLLLFKGKDTNVSKTQLPSNAVSPGASYPNGKENINGRDDKKSNGSLGSIVINGAPKYDISKAIFVMKTEIIIIKDGFVMLGFTHPINGKKIRVPLVGGDEYVMPKTFQIFIIFVDAQGRTLLILKGKDGNTIVGTTTNDDKNGDGKSPDKTTGSIVINGAPKYDISNAIFVMKTERIIRKDRVIMLEFTHPIIGKKIQVPLDGGDEYVMLKTSQVFTIFVDAQGRTLLILKGRDDTASTPQSPQNGTGSVENNVKPGNTTVGTTKTDNGKSADNIFGSIVINGVPKYDITTAIFVMKTEKVIGKDGVSMLRFTHPIISKKIQVPVEGGDEYVMPKTSQVFVIFVDAQRRTLLILKRRDDSVSTAQSPQNGTGFMENKVNPGNTIVGTTKTEDGKSPDNIFGSIVINGVPKYDITTAIFVMETEKIIGKDGVAMLRFTHPMIGKKIQVPVEGGDEYVMPKTSQVFVIFVDAQRRTLLILKRRDDSVSTAQSPLNGTAYVENTVNPGNTIVGTTKTGDGKSPDNIFGSIVINGVPKYDITTAIFVMETEKIIGKDGVAMLRFTHPIIGKKIQVPVEGGDEYVMPKTSQVFVIFVDAQRRTLLILKRRDDSVSTAQSPQNGTGFVENKVNPENTIVGTTKTEDGKSPDNIFGSIVINGVPKYDITTAIFVMETEKIIGKDGVAMLRFTHPIIGKKIQVPVEGGDEYVMPKTSQVFVIFVDAQRRTLLILKRRDDSVSTAQSPQNGTGFVENKVNPENTIVGTTKTEDGKSPDNIFGSIVINGVPKYDITTAIFVMETEKIIGKDGVAMLRFTHPIIGKKIQVPVEGGDEYVMPKTSQVFVIFVDAQRRTLLILKRRDDSVSTAQSPQNGTGFVENKVNPENTIVGTTKTEDGKSPDNIFGSIVINGVPKYDITTAIFVMETEKIIGKDGVAMLRFTHPIIGKKIQVPVEGGDEYVMPKTSQVFVIFVDAQRRTLLILKRRDDSVSTAQSPQNGTDSVENNVNPGNTIVGTTKTGDGKSPDNIFGSIVINGVPKYDITTAIFVMETEKIIGKDGVAMLRFTHPIIGKKIQVPVEGGDEYVMPKTSQVFVIFVDAQRRTLLILKRRDDSVSTAQSPLNGTGYVENTVNPGNTIVGTTKTGDGKSPDNIFGSIVINGVPKYDITTAIFVMETEKIIGKDGVAMLRFTHPIIGKKIQVPVEGGDEYVMPKTSQVFVIFVDAQRRTLLILKRRDDSVSTAQSPQNGTGFVENKVNPGNTIVGTTKTEDGKSPDNIFGSIVINGVPKYDITTAIFVMETEKIIGKDGVAMLRFTHPIIGKKIQVPLEGGDEYVIPKTSQVFVIFVDAQRRTLLILKGRDDSVSIAQSPQNGTGFMENNMEPGNTIVGTTNNAGKSPETNLGSVVINGVPKYDITTAIFVMETEKIIGKDGIAMLRFTHPSIGKKILIPLEGGDEYVMPKTSQVFVIFVDAQHRTLLILKSRDDSVSTAQSPQNGTGFMENNMEPGNTIVGTTNNAGKSPETNLGSVVINGVPKYDITRAMFVMETEKIIGKDGVAMLRFTHPSIGKKILIPLEGGDEYVMPKTSQVFVIFVDAQGQTLLILKGRDDSVSTAQSPQNGTGFMENNMEPGNTIVGTTNNAGKSPETNLGSVVINGVPKYDITTAIFVMETEKIIGKDGVAMLRFTHPSIGKKILIPLEGGDEYVMPKTSQVFVIFVDAQHRTLLILKSRDDSVSTAQSPQNGTGFMENNMEPGNTIVGTTNNAGKSPETNLGSVVINGVPKYDITTAIFVMETEKIIGKDGVAMLRFTHPSIGKKILIPLEGGDEYVMPKTSQVFVIFVDAQGQTLLILKGRDEKDTPGKFDQSPSNTESGTLVVGGRPTYDIPKALFVTNGKPITGKDGIPMLHFVHPLTYQEIDVPLHGGDTYVDPKTSRIYLIFVDAKGRTLLIPRNTNLPISPRGRPKENSGPARGEDNNLTNIDIFIEEYKKTSSKNKWGWIVIGGVPKYNLSNAITTMNTKKKVRKDGFAIIEFNHPITGQKMYVPYRGTEEYVDRKTLRAFVIFVDSQSRTLLIFKRQLPPSTSTAGFPSNAKTSGQFVWIPNTNVGSNTDLPKNGGLMVTGGVAGYDISGAVRVTSAENKHGHDGRTPKLEFSDPVTHKRIQIPSNIRDVYVDPKTGKKHVIVVGPKGRTYLILKGNENAKIGNSSVFGSLVVHGSPSYDVKHAISILQTTRKVSPNGMDVIEFVHPKTRQKIAVPSSGGDVHFDANTRKGFLIFVDRQGRTLLVFKKPKHPSSSPNKKNKYDTGNDNVNINSNVNENVYIPNF